MVRDRHEAEGHRHVNPQLTLRNHAMRIAIGFIVMIAFTAIANLLMKVGASVPVADRPVFGLLAWQSCAGIAVFGGALVIYSVLLQWLPLNVAQSVAALQFIAVIAASAYFLAEPISLGRWIGIVLIAAGILTVGLSAELSGGAESAHSSEIAGPHAG
jgi:undecaprenyl phosphate-alpha-L-ara4N flippase subunit ArnE